MEKHINDKNKNKVSVSIEDHVDDEIVQKSTNTKNNQLQEDQGNKNIVYLRPVVPLEEEQINRRNTKKKRNKKNKIIMVIVAVLVLVGVLYYTYMNVGVFTQVHTLKSYDKQAINNNEYRSFGDKIIRYGKDGMAMVDDKGVDLWNAPYQISNPMLDKFAQTGVIADRNGNYVIVFDEKQIIGEFKTNQPIEKISVSSQGIVAVLVSSGEIICYDIAGNILVEHKASEATVGQPIDIAISQQGTYLFVTYLHYSGGNINTNYRCYSLEVVNELSSDKLIIEESIKDSIAPEAFFVDETKAALVYESGIKLFDVQKGKELISVVVEGEIYQVIKSDKYFALALKNVKDLGNNELRIFNNTGKVVSVIEYQGEYSNMRIQGEVVILYEAGRCKIFTIKGKELFDGQMETEIIEILPLSGVNKYLVIGKNSWDHIRLNR